MSVIDWVVSDKFLAVAGIIVGVIFGIVGVIFGIVGVIFGRQSDKELRQVREELAHAKDTYSWEDVSVLVRDLAAQIKSNNPEILITTAGSPATITSMIVEHLYMWIPMYVIFVDAPSVEAGINMKKGESGIDTLYQRTDVVEGATWYIPRLLLNKPRRFVFVDDVAFSDSKIDRIQSLFKDRGFADADITFASLLLSKPIDQLLRQRGMSARYLKARLTKADKVQFPWGVERPENEKK